MDLKYLEISQFEKYSIAEVIINDLDLVHTPKLQNDLYDFVKSINYDNLIIDIRNLTYIDSIGLETLINLKKIINDNDNDNDLVVVCDVDSILELFKIVEMDKYFKNFQSLANAKEYFDGKRITKVS